jgi:hypothetical protein
MRRFRGVSHVHSTYSFDGRLGLPELSTFFAQRGIDFVLMSEHVEGLESEKIRSFIADCETYSKNSLLIPGIEIDALNALFYDVQASTGWRDYEDLARQLAAGGALVIVSHPVKIRRDISSVTKSLVEGVEVWNSRHDGKMALDCRIVSYWRSLRLQLGRNLVPLCGIDFHDTKDFIPLFLEVECQRLDRQNIMAEIRAGHHRIVRSEKTIPLDFAKGQLTVSYHLYSTLYRFVYRVIHAAHRATSRLGVRVPKGLRVLFRRVF